MTATGWAGVLEHIHITPAKSQPMQTLQEAKLIKGQGIEGDRYLLGTGTYSVKPGEDRQVTLIEAEMLERVAKDDGHPISMDEHRRNLTVRGVPLQHLVGLQFRVGSALLEGVRINQPCKYLNLMLKRDVYMALWNRSGLNCKVVDGGPIKVASVGRNDIIGEIAILLDVPRTATVQATSDLQTLKITKDLFFRMVTDFPEMGVEIMRVLAHRLDATNAQLRAAR